MTMTQRTATTLLELMIVVCIISCMIGLAIPIARVTRHQVLRVETLAILGKTETALHRYRLELGIYPYQEGGLNQSGAGTAVAHSNRLGHFLGSRLSDGDRERIAADMESAAAAFADPSDPVPPTSGPSRGHLVSFTAGDLGGQAGSAMVANRMGAQRARLSIVSGNLHATGPRMLDRAGSVVLDRTATVLLEDALSRENPGWSNDYLEGDIAPRYLHQDAILDAYLHPLIYINQTLPGMRSTTPSMSPSATSAEDPLQDGRMLGLGTEGFAPGTGPSASVIAAHRAVLLQAGRIVIDATDAGDGKPTPTDKMWFPSLSQPMHSDRRFYCGRGYEAEFELWSAGPDGRFDDMRDAAVNADNIAVTDYDRDVHP